MPTRCAGDNTSFNFLQRIILISHLLFTNHSDICFKILRQNRICNDREGLRRPASHAEGEEDSLAALRAEQSSCSHLRRRIAIKGGARGGVVNKLGGTGWLGGTCGHTLGASVWETHGQGRNCHIYDELTNVDREPFFSRRTVIAVEGLFCRLLMMTKMRTGDKVEDRPGCSCWTKRPLGSF